MKSVKRYISKKWLWIVTGLMLTEVEVKSAYTTRGYLSYGGEWLTLPLILMLAEVARCVGDIIGFLFGKEGDHEQGGD